MHMFAQLFDSIYFDAFDFMYLDLCIWFDVLMACSRDGIYI